MDPVVSLQVILQNDYLEEDKDLHFLLSELAPQVPAEPSRLLGEV